MTSAALVIAIDGPAGSGKSSVAKGLARQLGGIYLDTGAMYRAATWVALNSGLALDDVDAVVAACAAMDLQLSTDPDKPFVRVGDTDVTSAIRTPEVTAAVSAVSAIPAVRTILVDEQRKVARQIVADGRSVIVEGRDITTVVLPDADVLVYLTADPAVRAARRNLELVQPQDVSDTEQALRARDVADSSRAESPLTVSPHAHVVDATELSLTEVIAAVMSLVDATDGSRA